MSRYFQQCSAICLLLKRIAELVSRREGFGLSWRPIFFSCFTLEETHGSVLQQCGELVESMAGIFTFEHLSLPRTEAEALSSRRLLSSAKLILLSVFVAASYYIGTEIGFRFTPAGSTISTLWPPNAILFASLLLIPRRQWWLVLLMILPAHLISQVHSGVSVARALGWYASNSCEAVIGAYSVMFFAGPRFKFDRVRGTVVFLIFGFMLAPLLTSFVDAGVVVTTKSNADYWTMWTRRLFTNMLSVLTIVPPLVILGRTRLQDFSASKAARYLELICIVTATALLNIGTFAGTGILARRAPAMIYAPLPLLIWAAVRLGPGGLSLSVLTGAIVSIWKAVHGHGPFASVSVRENVLYLQILNSITAAPLMLLSAMLSELKATENALRESRQEMLEAQECERRRIAGELHDNVGQQLVLAEIQLAEIKAAVSATVNPLINKLSNQLLELSTDVREISHGLYPSLLQNLGLTPALRRLSQEISVGEEFEVLFISAIDESVPPRLALALYRVAQEALQNISKHSHARHVQVELRRDADGITLRVRDDGIGFDVGQQAGTGVGFESMQERLQAIGGTLRVYSDSTKGTDLRAFVPFAAADELEAAV
jgi:signal transduction histidine kinase